MFCFHGPGRTLLGLRRFRPQDVLPFLPGWSVQQARETLEELVKAGLVLYDPEQRVLFVTVQYEHSPISGIKSLQGAIKALEDFPPSPVLRPVVEHLWTGLAEAGAAMSGAKAEAVLAAMANHLKAWQERLGRRAAGGIARGEPQGGHEAQDTAARPPSGRSEPGGLGQNAPNPDAPSMGDTLLAEVEQEQGNSGSTPDAPSDMTETVKAEAAYNHKMDNPAKFAKPGCPIDGGSDFRKFPLPEPEPEPNPPLPPPQRAGPGGRGGRRGGRKAGKQERQGRRRMTPGKESNYAKFDR